jgi:hypothetical protein
VLELLIHISPEAGFMSMDGDLGMILESCFDIVRILTTGNKYMDIEGPTYATKEMEDGFLMC